MHWFFGFLWEKTDFHFIYEKNSSNEMQTFLFYSRRDHKKRHSTLATGHGIETCTLRWKTTSGRW
jgi:hypothetical protein